MTFELALAAGDDSLKAFGRLLVVVLCCGWYLCPFAARVSVVAEHRDIALSPISAAWMLRPYVPLLLVLTHLMYLRPGIYFWSRISRKHEALALETCWRMLRPPDHLG